MKSCGNIRGVLWDFDGTLSDFELDGAAPVVKACVAAVLSLGVPLKPAEAYEAAESAFKRYGRYYPHFEQYGIDRREFHNAFYAALDPCVVRVSRKLCDGFSRLAGVGHVLLSHSARVWIEAGIGRLGLSKHFPPGRIVALEDCDYLRKDESQIPFTKGLDVLHLPPTATAMVDDSVCNLEIPYEMGMVTILVNRARALTSSPDCVHHVVGSATEALKVVSSRNSEGPVHSIAGCPSAAAGCPANNRGAKELPCGSRERRCTPPAAEAAVPRVETIESEKIWRRC